MYNPVIKLESGEVQGGVAETDNFTKYYYFKGVPYAEPPLGELRFKSPVPVKPWTGRRSALTEGNKCPQLNFLKMEEIVGNEDCLYLNVYTPSLPQNGDHKMYPVMVFIHGGGFKMGCGDYDMFGPDFFVDKDIVLVTINYRVGVLGFLCLDIPEVPGNAGLRDQNLALLWVQKNIASFSGDPNNVTLFGSSAGSASVEYQMISPMSKNLFHKAILQSGSTLNPWARNRKPDLYVQKLRRALGLSANDGLKLLIQLQNVSVERLLSYDDIVIDEDAITAAELFGFGPVVEFAYENVEGFLTSEPIDILTSGNFVNIPTIAGFCSNEGATFRRFYENHIEKLKSNYVDYMTSYNIDDKIKLNSMIKDVYTSADRAETEQLNNFLSDLLFNSGIIKSLKCRLESGERTYFYLFSYDGCLYADFPIFANLRGQGTLHGSDVAYLTKSVIFDEGKITQNDRLTRRRMISMWTNFAKFGDPTPEEVNDELIKWNNLSKENKKLLDINEEVKMKEFPFRKRIELWEEIYNTNIY